MLLIISFRTLPVRKHAMQPCLTKTTIYLISLLSFINMFPIFFNSVDCSTIQSLERRSLCQVVN